MSEYNWWMCLGNYVKSQEEYNSFLSDLMWHLRISVGAENARRHVKVKVNARLIGKDNGCLNTKQRLFILKNRSTVRSLSAYTLLLEY